MRSQRLARLQPALVLSALVMSMPGLATAELSPEQAAARVIAGPCASCHGPDGRSPGAIPSIAGLPEAELQAKLIAFKAGEVADATVMTRLMKGYSETEIAALAKWFAEIEQ